jgi:hypothetical protein
MSTEAQELNRIVGTSVRDMLDADRISGCGAGDSGGKEDLPINLFDLEMARNSVIAPKGGTAHVRSPEPDLDLRHDGSSRALTQTKG